MLGKSSQCWVIQVEINIFADVQAIEKAEVRALALHLQLDGPEVGTITGFYLLIGRAQACSGYWTLQKGLSTPSCMLCVH
jgi:hypothetical protein